MKLNIAFQTLLVATRAVSCAHARATTYFRDPRTVEKKEQVQRRTMGDFRLPTMLETDVDGTSCEDRLKAEASSMATGANPTEEERSLACSAVSKDHSECLGCQGFSQVGKEVHIPGCVGMTPDECYSLAHGIVLYKPGWFKDRDGTALVTEQLDFFPAETMTYYKLGLPVSAGDPAPEGSKEVVGVAGNCMVHYSWDWCVSSSSNDDTMCLQLQPWDCSGASAGKCLSSSECCAKIQGEYPKPDINNNELQCYEWVLPVKSSPLPSAAIAATGATVGVSSGGLTGNRLVIHTEKCSQTCSQNVFPNDLIQDNDDGKIGSPYPKTLKAAAKAYMEQDCTNDHNCAIGQKWGHPINSWCVKQVTTFHQVFKDLTSFNEDINCWTTGQVTSMHSTFWGASVFNQPLNNWDVSSVTNMAVLFRHTAFNQPLDSWNVSRVSHMASMFNGASAFNQPLNNWDVSQVASMGYMFNDASAFNQPLGGWDVPKVSSMYRMFKGATLFNQNLCHFGAYYEDSFHKYKEMFESTSCTDWSDAFSRSSADGPWCQDCK